MEKSKKEVDKALDAVSDHYVRIGGESRLTVSNAVKWFEKANVFQITDEVVDKVFPIGKGKKGLKIKRFKEAAREICRKKKVEIEDVMKKLAASGPSHDPSRIPSLTRRVSASQSKPEITQIVSLGSVGTEDMTQMDPLSSYITNPCSAPSDLYDPFDLDVLNWTASEESLSSLSPFNVAPPTPCATAPMMPCVTAPMTPCATAPMTCYDTPPMTPCDTPPLTPCDTAPMTCYDTPPMTPCATAPMTCYDTPPPSPCNTPPLRPCDLNHHLHRVVEGPSRDQMKTKMVNGDPLPHHAPGLQTNSGRRRRSKRLCRRQPGVNHLMDYMYLSNNGDLSGLPLYSDDLPKIELFGIESDSRNGFCHESRPPLARSTTGDLLRLDETRERLPRRPMRRVVVENYTNSCCLCRDVNCPSYPNGYL